MTVLFALLVLATGAFGAPSVNEPKLGIIGGNFATKGQFPYQVSFQACFQGKTDMCQHLCGGAILSPTTVITAANCFPISSYYTYRIVAGALNLTEDNPEKQTINVTSFVFHPEYVVNNHELEPNDLAIVHLADKLEFNDCVQPIKLPPQGFWPNGTATIAGWGSIITDPTLYEYSDTLKTIKVSVVPDIQVCTNTLQDFFNSTNFLVLQEKGSSVCTVPSEGESACGGDNGGPLVNSDNLLVGIESSVFNPCGSPGVPNVHVNVGSYVQWIVSQITDLA